MQSRVMLQDGNRTLYRGRGLESRDQWQRPDEHKCERASRKQHQDVACLSVYVDGDVAWLSCCTSRSVVWRNSVGGVMCGVAQASGKVIVRVSGIADEEGSTAYYESSLASFATFQTAPYLHVP